MRLAKVFERHFTGFAALPSFQRGPGAFGLPLHCGVQIVGRFRGVEMLADDHPQRRGEAYLAPAGEGSRLAPQPRVEPDADGLAPRLHVAKFTTLLASGQVTRRAPSPRPPAP